MRGGLSMFIEILFIVFYGYVFYLIGKKFKDKKKFVHCLLLTLVIFAISSIYDKYSFLIKNEVVSEIFSDNFFGAAVGSLSFWPKEE